MTGPAAPKDPEKARPFFYILKDKDVFGERQKDGTGIQFIYESDGRLINSAQITGNVTDKEELTLLETVEGFGRLVQRGDGPAGRNRRICISDVWEKGPVRRWNESYGFS